MYPCSKWTLTGLNFSFPMIFLRVCFLFLYLAEHLANEGKVIECVYFLHRPCWNFYTVAVVLSHGTGSVCLQPCLVLEMVVVSFLRGDRKSFSELWKEIRWLYCISIILSLLL